MSLVLKLLREGPKEVLGTLHNLATDLVYLQISLIKLMRTIIQEFTEAKISRHILVTEQNLELG